MSCVVISKPVAAGNVIVPLPSDERMLYDIGLTVCVVRVLPRLFAWPVTLVSANPPEPLAVSLKLVSRMSATPPLGNSRLETQYGPVSTRLVTGLTGARIAINRSNVVGPASVDEPTSTPSAPSRALTVTPASKGFVSVTKPPGLTV